MSATDRANPPSATALPLAVAIRDSEPLARLAERLRQSRARHDTIAACLPATLQAVVKPGPIDEQTWTLLVPNGAVAAKLRQLLPTLQQQLLDSGWPPLTLRVRVVTR